MTVDSPASTSRRNCCVTGINPSTITDIRFRDRAPDAPEITDYDRLVAATYLRLVDAAADGADWREVVHNLFGRDASVDPLESSVVAARDARGL